MSKSAYHADTERVYMQGGQRSHQQTPLTYWWLRCEAWPFWICDDYNQHNARVRSISFGGLSKFCWWNLERVVFLPYSSSSSSLDSFPKATVCVPDTFWRY